MDRSAHSSLTGPSLIVINIFLSASNSVFVGHEVRRFAPPFLAFCFFILSGFFFLFLEWRTLGWMIKEARKHFHLILGINVVTCIS